MADADNVVPIRPGMEPEPAPGEVNSDTVKQLEELLQRARDGEIIGIAYACQHPDRMTTFYSTGYLTRAAIGALCLLQADMCKLDLTQCEANGGSDH